MENEEVIIDIFNYYKNQVYKMLGLFEDEDSNGYLHCIRIRSELEQLPYQFPSLNNNYQFNVVLTKIDAITDEILFLDGEHRFVKNHVMESLNLLDDIKEGLK